MCFKSLVVNCRHLKHRLISKRGVHLFRYFLSLMRTPHFVTKQLKTSAQCSCLLKCGVCIRDRKYLNRCTPLFDVSLWNACRLFLWQRKTLDIFRICFKLMEANGNMFDRVVWHGMDSVPGSLSHRNVLSILQPLSAHFQFWLPPRNTLQSEPPVEPV